MIDRIDPHPTRAVPDAPRRCSTKTRSTSACAADVAADHPIIEPDPPCARNVGVIPPATATRRAAPARSVGGARRVSDRVVRGRRLADVRSAKPLRARLVGLALAGRTMGRTNGSR